MAIKHSPGCTCCGEVPTGGCGEIIIADFDALRAATDEYPTSPTADESAMLAVDQIPNGWFCVSNSSNKLIDPSSWVVTYRFDDSDDFEYPCVIRLLSEIDSTTSNVGAGTIGDHLYAEYSLIAESNQNDLGNDVRLSIGKVVGGIETELEVSWIDRSGLSIRGFLDLTFCRSRVYREFLFIGPVNVSTHNSLGDLLSAGLNQNGEAAVVTGGPKTYAGFITTMTVQDGDVIVNIDPANSSLFVSAWRIIREFDPSSDPLLSDIGDDLTDGSSLVATAAGNVEDDTTILHAINEGDTLTLDDRTDPGKWASYTLTTDSALDYFDKVAFYPEWSSLPSKQDSIEIAGAAVTGSPGGDRWGLEGVTFCGEAVGASGTRVRNATYWSYVADNDPGYNEDSTASLFGDSGAVEYEAYIEFDIDPDDIDSGGDITLDIGATFAGAGSEFYIRRWISGTRPAVNADMTIVNTTGTLVADKANATNEVSTVTPTTGGAFIGYYLTFKDADLVGTFGASPPTLTYTPLAPTANGTFDSGNVQRSLQLEEPDCDPCEGTPICPCDGATEEAVWFKGSTDLTLADQWADFKTGAGLAFDTETLCGTQDWWVTRNKLCGGTCKRYSQYITSRDNAGTTVYDRFEVWQTIDFYLDQLSNGKYIMSATCKIFTVSRGELTVQANCLTIEEKAVPNPADWFGGTLKGLGGESVQMDADNVDCTNFLLTGEITSSGDAFHECDGGSPPIYCGVQFTVENT